MKEFKKNLSKNLKKHRQDNNLSQEIAAESMGISPVFLSQLERCIANPSCKTLITIYRQMGYDYIPINPTSDEKAYRELLTLINQNPEICESLLAVAKNLTQK